MLAAAVAAGASSVDSVASSGSAVEARMRYMELAADADDDEVLNVHPAAAARDASSAANTTSASVASSFSKSLPLLIDVTLVDRCDDDDAV